MFNSQIDTFIADTITQSLLSCLILKLTQMSCVTKNAPESNSDKRISTWYRGLWGRPVRGAITTWSSSTKRRSSTPPVHQDWQESLLLRLGVWLQGAHTGGLNLYQTYFINCILSQVYHMTRNFEKFVEFRTTLEEWKISRNAKDAEQVWCFFFDRFSTVNQFFQY